MEIHAIDALIAIMRRDIENVANIADEPLIRTYGLANDAGTGVVHRSEIVTTLCARMPTLAGEVALALARGDDAEAVRLVTAALGALYGTDEALFVRAPSETEFIKLLRRMMPPTTARAHAQRTGVEEKRREAYVLRHKFANEAYPLKYVPEVERRNGVIGLPLMQARAALADVHDAMTDQSISARVKRWASSATTAPEPDAVDHIDAHEPDTQEKQ